MFIKKLSLKSIWAIKGFATPTLRNSIGRRALSNEVLKIVNEGGGCSNPVNEVYGCHLKRLLLPQLSLSTGVFLDRRHYSAVFLKFVLHCVRFCIFLHFYQYLKSWFPTCFKALIQFETLTMQITCCKY